MSNIVPTAEFEKIGLNPNLFKRSCEKSWRGACPRCGGHRRYVVFTDHEFPNWHGYCETCGYKVKYWQVVNRQAVQPLTEAEKQRIAAQEALAAEERAAYRRTRLAEFSSAELWQELHDRMGEENYAWWQSQGIPRDWADFWRLGYTPEKTFEFDGQLFTSPAYSIPKFDLNWTPVNMDYRLLNPPPGAGKYRPAAGLSAAAFFSRPDLSELSDEVFVCEGSKKGMVLTVRFPDEQLESRQVIAVPAKGSWGGVEERLRDCGRVWIILDPDALLWAVRMALSIGPQTRLVELPTKLDDAFVQYKMSRRVFEDYLHRAVKVQ